MLVCSGSGSGVSMPAVGCQMALLQCGQGTRKALNARLAVSQKLCSICDKPMRQLSISVDRQVIRRVAGSARSASFTAFDFAGLGKPEAVRQALRRLVARGELARARRGLYFKPRAHPIVGTTGPDTLAAIRKLMERSAAEWQFSGAAAANLLGLSEQVPSRWVVVTSGNPRKVRIGKTGVEFRHAAPRNLLGGDRPAGLVFQALRYLGARGVTPARISHLRGRLDKKAKKELADLCPLMPRWMQPAVQQIVGMKARE